MDEQKLQQLEKQVAELENWKASQERQQIKFPVDSSSRKILDINMLVPTGNEGPFVLTDLMSYGLEVIYNGFKCMLYASLPVFECTAAVDDVITSTGGQHNLVNGNGVIFGTTNTLPAPLDSTVTYYVVSATPTTFKVSLTSGGAAVDITDTGTGTQYFSKI